LSKTAKHCEVPAGHQHPDLPDQEPPTCEHYAQQSARLKVAGTPIGGNDLWIACHALSMGATLVTNNTREFERISGLQLANWAA